MSQALADLWPYVTSGSAIVLAAVATGHAVLHKREVRAAIGWVGIVWLVPLLGPVLYYLLGINRIRRRASRLRPDSIAARQETLLGGEADEDSDPAALGQALSPSGRHLITLRTLGDRVVPAPLVAGNEVEALVGGDVAYAAMISAIEDAERSVALSSYIFDHDAAGLRFVEALGRARSRGVEVRVLIDGLGALYSRRSMAKALSARGVTSAKFLHSYIPWRMAYLNLRNHRKILVVDGRTGFTGGMNIRVGHCLDQASRRPLRDVHFRFEGPVVKAMLDVFTDDWQFTTGERLSGPVWYAGDPTPPPRGEVFARAVADGPDEDLDRLSALLLGALSLARQRIRLVTPYFLPDRVMISALRQAILRGVEVQIVIPERSNLPFVDWAARAQLRQVMEEGCEVWLGGSPFDHAKLLTVDGLWTLVGSSNWDPRSLRLNFELNVECFDRGLGQIIDRLIDDRMRVARRLSTAELDARNVPVRLRDGVAWLFSPYL